LGHDVTLIATGDAFKNFPADIKIETKTLKGLQKKWNTATYLLFRKEARSAGVKRQFFEHSEQLKGHDIVQLINENPFGALPGVETEIISFLHKNNKKLFLLSCGADHLSVRYALSKKARYSILTPYFEGKVSKKQFAPILRFAKPAYKKLHGFVFSKIEGVIASDLDYHPPLAGHPKYRGVVPNPINISKLNFKPVKVSGKVVIFHGINRRNYHKKGSDLFEAALQMVQKKYAQKVETITVQDVPYAQYINSYNRAHILLDQVYAYDQGYNALEAMAKGKVVFTGAETEFKNYYGLTKTVAVNALPDAQKIAGALGELIENPSKIEKIAANARNFIKAHHDHIVVAGRYLSVWGE
ncbi:MAG: glycosyltransferase, partial [Marinirhabdus sp.]